jgi:hypothetical protein
MLSWTLQANWIASKAREKIVDRQPLGQDWKELPWFRRISAWFWYFGKSETLAFFTDGFLWFAYGTAAVFKDRKDAHEYFKNNNVWASEDEVGKEDDIEGFGQLVPLLLVGVPLLQLLQIYCSKSHPHRVAKRIRGLTPMQQSQEISRSRRNRRRAKKRPTACNLTQGILL